ncbi:MAG: amidohydrolase family protein [Candidatus Aminicenantes bacterium]|nr:amidohydrolase family protein [Candidatus Aminicenantes bacterium]
MSGKMSKGFSLFYKAAGAACAVFFVLPVFFSRGLSAEVNPAIAIKGGTVLTMAGEKIENGIVVLWEGKIAAVGKQVSIPDGATIIDATGKYVMPGIVDAMTYYGIRPFSLNDRGNAVTPENKIILAYYPFGRQMHGEKGVVKDREILSGGVTTVYIAPGDQQVIGGQGAVVKVYGDSYEGFTLREPAAIDMCIGDPPKNEFSMAAKTPTTRMGIATLIRKAFLGAQQYKQKIDDYEAKSGEEKEKTPHPPRNLGTEAMIDLLNKEVPARIESDFVDDIRTAIRLCEEFGVDLIIDSGLGAYKVKQILSEKNIPVVLGPPTHPFIQGGEVSMTPDLYREMNEYNAAELIKSGVRVALGSFGFGFGGFGYATQGRWLLIEAAYLTGFGVSDDDALRMITINAAEILGVNNRVGSLEKGKDADVIILSGYPLDIKTWVDQVFIDGKSVYQRKEGAK